MLNWSLFSKSELAALLGTDFEKGLSSAAALLRGTGTDAAVRELADFFHPIISFFKALGEMLRDFSVLLLVICALLCQVFADSSPDALGIIIGFVVCCALFRTALNMYLEHVSKERISADTYKVLRDGKIKTVKANALVRGDVIVLSKGDIVPCDLRLVESDNLTVIEKYNGKRVKTVEKDAMYFPVQLQDSLIGHKKNMVFEGSAVTSGNALAVVIDKSMSLSMARKVVTINDDVAGYYEEKNKEQDSRGFKKLSAFSGANFRGTYGEDNSVTSQIERVSSFMKLCGLVGGSCIFVIGVLAGVELSESFMFGVTVMAWAPTVLYEICSSAAFAVGCARLIRQGVFVKDFESAEKLTLSKSVLCCGSTVYSIDKMVAEACYVGRSLEFKKENISNIARLTELLLCTSELGIRTDKSGNSRIVGDMEGRALYTGAREIGVVRGDTLSMFTKRISEFHDINGSLTSVFTLYRGKTMLISKGSVASLLSKCSYYDFGGDAVKLEDSMRDRILENAKSYENNESCHVVAVCYKPLDVVSKGDFKDGFVFAGFIVFGTRLNYSSSKYVKLLRKNGITPVLFSSVASDMVLSDAKKLGISTENDNYITSKSLSALDESIYSEELSSYTHYMSLTSAQKRAVVRGKKHKEKVVAVAADKPADALDMSECDVLISFGKDAPKTLRRVSDIHSKSGGIDVIYRTVCICRNMIRCASLSAGHLALSQISALVLCIFAMLCAFFTGGVLPMSVPMLCCAVLITDLALSVFTALIRTPDSIISDSPEAFYGFYKMNRIMKKAMFAGVVCGCAAFLAFLIGVFMSRSTAVASACAFITLYLSKCFVSLFCVMKTSTRKAPAHFPTIWAVSEVILGVVLALSLGVFTAFENCTIIIPIICLVISVIPMLMTKIFSHFDAVK